MFCSLNYLSYIHKGEKCKSRCQIKDSLAKCQMTTYNEYVPIVMNLFYMKYYLI